jgi:hypothetical protein
MQKDTEHSPHHHSPSLLNVARAQAACFPQGAGPW